MNDTMSLDAFENRYWYKAELSKLCSKFGLSSHGTKSKEKRHIYI